MDAVGSKNGFDDGEKKIAISVALDDDYGYIEDDESLVEKGLADVAFDKTDFDAVEIEPRIHILYFQDFRVGT